MNWRCARRFALVAIASLTVYNIVTVGQMIWYWGH